MASSPARSKREHVKKSDPDFEYDESSGGKRKESSTTEETIEAPKKGRTTDDFTMNVNEALDKAHEGLSFNQILTLPPSALQGLAERADGPFARLGLSNINDMAEWKFFRIARAIHTLSSVEETGKRPSGAQMNLNNAMDKAWETKSLKEMASAPPSALQGLAGWVDEVLADFHIRTIEELATNKYFHWASAIKTLSEMEVADFGSK